mgnify:CR=1 FL=1
MNENMKDQTSHSNLVRVFCQFARDFEKGGIQKKKKKEK